MRILEEVRREPRGPTRLAQAVNMAFDKCLPHITTLEQKGFITKTNVEGRDKYSITQAGVDLHQSFRRFWEMWGAGQLPRGEQAL